MNNSDLENLCEEFKTAPYKIYKDNLPFVFGDIINNIDRWSEFPFKKDDRFVDFARGMGKITGKKPDAYDADIHKDHTGFVILNPNKRIELPFPHPPDFFPWSAFIYEGEIKYAQAEHIKKDIIERKTAIFSKNNFTLQIKSSKNDAYECTITYISREHHSNLQEGYELQIKQLNNALRVEIHSPRDILKQELQVLKPVIQLEFRGTRPNDQPLQILNRLDKYTSPLNNFSGLRSIIGTENISGTSEIYRFMQKTGVAISGKHQLTFNDAVHMLKYISENKA